MVATILPFAALGEIVGVRTVFLSGIVIFTVASALCALSHELALLSAARALQGLGASAIMAVNTALTRFIFPARHLGRGTGLTALTVATCFTLGPSVAAAILEIAPSWVWLFAINIPFGIGALALAFFILPHTPKTARPFDFAGAFLNMGAFGFLILGLGEGTHQASLPQVITELGLGTAIGVLLLKSQLKKSAPIFPIDLFRIRNFALSAATAVCAFSAQGLAFVSLPFLFQVNFAFSNAKSGLLLTPWPLVVAVMGVVAGPLSDRYPAGILCGIGLSVLAVGLVSLALLPEHADPFSIGWRLALCGLGFGFYQAPNVRALMVTAPRERSGSASGMVAMVRLSGQAFGSSLAALCFSVLPHSAPYAALAAGAAASVIGAAASLLRLSRA
jgi:DHA2 family multidrug resistance protein-like MFS transporter